MKQGPEAGSTQPEHAPARTVASSRRKARRRSEDGFALAWTALMLPILLGFAGVAIDLGNWYLNVQRLQRATDAAALAGDPYMPNDLAGATKAAKEAMARNGMPQSAIDAAVIGVVPGQPTQLSVSASTTVKNYFLQLIKLGDNQTFTRGAIANHRSGLHLGNGSNVLGGYEPGPTKWGNLAAGDGGYYIAISGTKAPKVDGDRKMAGRCDSYYYGPPRAYAPIVDGCDYNGSQANYERDPLGYAFRVNIKGVANAGVSKLVLQAYDPGFAKAGGNKCNEADNSWVNVPMWENGVGCTGESAYTPADGQIGNPGVAKTIFGLYDSIKSTTPISTCRTYDGTFNASQSLGKPGFEWIHQWSTVCDPITVDLTKDRTLILRVRSQDGDGTNGFALRAGLSASGDPNQVNTALSQQRVTITAEKDMAIFNAYSNGTSTFPLAQVASDQAGRSVKLEMFDVVDSRKAGIYQTAQVRLLDNNGNALPGVCYYTPPNGAKVALGNCTATVGGNNSFQGRVTSFEWQVPTNYSCLPVNRTRYGGCWIKVQVSYAAGATVNDFTTWTLDEPDEPLRLIK